MLFIYSWHLTVDNTEALVSLIRQLNVRWNLINVICYFRFPKRELNFGSVLTKVMYSFLYLASIVHSRFRRFGVRLVEFKILKGPDFFSNITRFQNAYLDYAYNTLVYKLYCSLLIDTKLLAIFFLLMASL